MGVLSTASHGPTESGVAPALVYLCLCFLLPLVSPLAPSVYEGQGLLAVTYNQDRKVVYVASSENGGATTKLTSLTVGASGVLHLDVEPALFVSMAPDLLISRDHLIVVCSSSSCTAIDIPSKASTEFQLPTPYTADDQVLLSPSTGALWVSQGEGSALLSVGLPYLSAPPRDYRSLSYDRFNKRYTVRTMLLTEQGDDIITVFTLDGSHLYVSRVCNTKGDQLVHSFSAVELLCSSMTSFKDAYLIPPKHLYVLGATDERPKICLFDLDTIREALNSGWYGCDVLSFRDMYKDYTERCSPGSGAGPDLASTLAPVCLAAHQQGGHAPTGADPQRSTNQWLLPVDPSAVIVTPDGQPSKASLYALDLHGDIVVAIIVTESALKQVQLYRDGSVDVFDTWSEASGPIIGDQLLESSVFMITETHLYPHLLYNCASRSGVFSPDASCQWCVGLVDPYCGWCSLNQTCTSYSDCSLNDYWLPSQGPLSCYSVSLQRSSPAISAESLQADSQATLTLNKLPSTDPNDPYFCSYFGGDSVQDVTFNPPADPSVDLLTLTCALPSLQTIQAKIRSSGDELGVSVSTQLSIQLNGHTFGAVSLSFYDCSLLSSCARCSKSTRCSWSAQQFICSQRSATQGETITNLKDCPSIAVSMFNSTAYVHSGHMSAIQFNVVNFQTPVQDLVCKVGNESIAGTIGPNSSDPNSPWVLTCSTYSFAYSHMAPYENLTFTLHTSAGTQIDSPHPLTVRLYKCSLLATQCSQCLGVEHYQCVWCGHTESTAQCLTATQCQPSPQYYLYSECPDPKIFSVTPSSGPLQGGTRLTIEGDNFGKTFSDVLSVTIELPQGVNVSCDPIQSEYKSANRIVCITQPCPSPVSTAGFILVKARVDRTILETTAKFQYDFKKLKVESVFPSRGPVSGGTDLTVGGVNLLAGSRATVTMCGQPCSTVNTANLTTGQPRSDQGTQIICRIPPCSRGDLLLSITLDRFIASIPFSYVPDPYVSSVSPMGSIQSGGILVTIMGSRLSLISNPLFYMRVRVSQDASTVRTRGRRMVEGDQWVTVSEPCFNVTAESIHCVTPSVPEQVLPTTTAGPHSLPVQDYGLIIGNVSQVRHLGKHENFSSFVVYSDPIFFNFSELVRPLNREEVLQIKGSGIESLGKQEAGRGPISVDVGPHYQCPMDYVDDQRIGCRMPPVKEPITITVCVKYGQRLQACVGTLDYQEGRSVAVSNSLPVEVVVSVSVAGALLVIFVVVLVYCCHKRAQKKDQKMKNLQNKMERLEMSVAAECKEAFAELQTDMDELVAEADGGALTLPFFDYKAFCVKVMFPKTGPSEPEHPVLRGLELPRDERTAIRQGLRDFEELIYNKTFLLTLVRTLDADTKLSMRNRANVASLISVILQERMSYFTLVLKTLLSDLISQTVSKGTTAPQLLFRRSDHVAVSLLTNWFTCLLHPFLKECAGEPLFVLYQGIRQQVAKGPVDALTHDAKYSLSQDKLLRTQVEYEVKPIRLLSPDEDSYPSGQVIKVLDCDTISQVKAKILDVLYRNVAYSSGSRPRHENLDLEWVRTRGDRVKLEDLPGPTSGWSREPKGDPKELWTLRHYQVPNMATMALVPRENVPYSFTASGKPSKQSKSGESLTTTSFSRNASTTNLLGGAPPSSSQGFYHLVKPNETESHELETGRLVSEVYLTRLLATKGTLQKFVNDLLEVIFTTAHRASALPMPIKYMFDFLDEEALVQGICDPDVVHAWKSNCLPLRFWVNLIKNPDFVFDIDKSPVVDAGLSMVAQVFMEGCSLSGQQPSKNSPCNKLLYARDIPKYKDWVQSYYQDIKMMPGLNEADMNEFLLDMSQAHSGQLQVEAALYHLYKNTADYAPKLMDSFKQDEFARQHKLLPKLTQVMEKLSPLPDVLP